jgi:hypothetical protein
VLGWASKDQPRHYIDLAYIARDHRDILDGGKAAKLISEKFAREKHSGRYKQRGSVLTAGGSVSGFFLSVGTF